MKCEEAKKNQLTCTQHRKKAKPNAFWKASSIIKPSFKGISAPSFALLNNEERKTVEAHQLEVELKRSEAITRKRNFIL